MLDFTKIPHLDLDNKEVHIDVTKQLGNALYYNSQDIAGSELGKRIYHSDGPLNLTHEEKQLVKTIVPQVFAYVIREAILKAIDAEVSPK